MKYQKSHNGHALVVIGYDDIKFGGSFEVMNSWGTNWGSDGYCWIRYKDFEHFVYYGYDLIDANINGYSKLISGLLYLKLANGEFMEFCSEENIYTSAEPFPPQTEFEIFISANNYFYLYCFSLDNEGNFNILFPQNSIISNLIPYRNSGIPIPDEDHYLKLNEKGSEDYLIVLISKNKINWQSVINKLKIKRQYSTTLIKKIVDHSSISTYVIDKNKIAFELKSSDTDLITIIIKINKANF
ncbi:C1 family peptidase [Ignavibacterium sp.]|uniref:DUF4384 domain-containing protein n=1 Tax=Ignavibacterium sp. TaxID=2651167 RepID=UPI00307E3A9F